jgi:hypothetical protein
MWLGFRSDLPRRQDEHRTDTRPRQAEEVVLLPGGVLETPMNPGEICVLPIVYPDSFCSIP